MIKKTLYFGNLPIFVTKKCPINNKITGSC